MSLAATRDAPARRLARLTIDYQSVVNAVFAAFIFFGMLSLIEPSPYDFLTLLALPLWVFGGFRLHRSLVPILALWLVFEVAGFLSLMPYWDEHDAKLYQLQSLYLFVTTVFFTIFFSERAEIRATLCLRAFTAGAIVSAIAGLIGYLNIGGLASIFTMEEGRVSATFKDPNVFGSYLVLSACYLLQLLLLGRTRRTAANRSPSAASTSSGSVSRAGRRRTSISGSVFAPSAAAAICRAAPVREW